MKEFGWILLLQAELNCNCPKFPSDLKLTSSVDKLMWGNSLRQGHFLSCWISSSVLTENSVYQVLNVKNWDRDWNIRCECFFFKSGWVFQEKLNHMFSGFKNNPYLTWCKISPKFLQFRVTEKSTTTHSAPFFFQLCPLLGVNVCLEILLKNREIEYL